jgi:hypothetical protein
MSEANKSSSPAGGSASASGSSTDSAKKSAPFSAPVASNRPAAAAPAASKPEAPSATAPSRVVAIGSGKPASSTSAKPAGKPAKPAPAAKSATAKPAAASASKSTSYKPYASAKPASKPSSGSNWNPAAAAAGNPWSTAQGWQNPFSDWTNTASTQWGNIGTGDATAAVSNAMRFGHENIEAAVECGSVANQWARNVRQEAMQYATATMANATDASRRALECRTAHDFAELCNRNFQSSTEMYVDYLSRLSSLWFKLSADTTEPLGARVSAATSEWTQNIQSATKK